MDGALNVINYFVDPVTAKLISANFDFPTFSSNPPNLIPANISGYTVYRKLETELLLSENALEMIGDC